MSAKINLAGMVKGHWSTLRDAGSGRVCRWDLFTFYAVPSVIAAIVASFGKSFSESSTNLLVNIGAILTGLLLNLLVLVYDQKTKVPPVNADDPHWETNQHRRTILQELYYNISYCTFISLLLVLVAIVHNALGETKLDLVFLSARLVISTGSAITTPLMVLFGLNLIFTIMMILKRIYVLLTTEDAVGGT